MKIAIVNLTDIDELQYTLECLSIIQEDIIDARIDLYIEKKYSHKVKIDSSIRIFPIDLANVSIFGIKRELNVLFYYGKTKYDIAVDTEGSLKSAIVSYILSGRTSGFKLKSLATLFYDEKIYIPKHYTKQQKVKQLLIETFGIYDD